MPPTRIGYCGASCTGWFFAAFFCGESTTLGWAISRCAALVYLEQPPAHSPISGFVPVGICLQNLFNNLGPRGSFRLGPIGVFMGVDQTIEQRAENAVMR